MQRTFQQWASLTDEHLATRDIAFANLRWAVGLPGFDPAAIPAYQQKLNDWASAVKATTERMLPQFQVNPSRFDGSPGKFRMLALVTVLQRDFGVSYNQKFMQGEYDGRDPRNLFLHGVLTGFGGTCVTMPLLYIAIGRRLGYPLFLVEAKEHYFVRWEGQGERFNIEATSQGFVARNSDEYYHAWPKRITKDELAKGIFLRNLVPREEVASSWLSRGQVFFEHLRLDEAVEAFHHAWKMAPKLATAQGSLSLATAAHLILQNRKSLPNTLSLSESIEKASPPATLPWHASAIRHAQQELLRIHRNREKSARASGQVVPSESLRLVERKRVLPPYWDEAIGGVCTCSVGMQPPPCTWPGCPHRNKSSSLMPPMPRVDGPRVDRLRPARPHFPPQ